MKRILVKFYSARNFGDDLFIDILMERFGDCRIDLLSSMKYNPRPHQPHTRVHPYSHVDEPLWCLCARVNRRTKAGKLLEILPRLCQKGLILSHDAYVRIGGSIFMDEGQPEEEIGFSAGIPPVFDYTSRPRSSGNTFLIGANLGPVYSDSYWNTTRDAFLSFRHVCVRDYASYQAMRDLPHVQYAPDVVFLARQPEPADRGENVVISVVDISRHTTDAAVRDAYFGLLRDTIGALASRNIPVTLVSFCKAEGDEDAIDHLMSLLPDRSGVSVCCYDGNIPKLLSLLSDATYIIASRFHAMILALSFGKPVFPISYNCKSRHYLEDLDFRGKFASLSDLPETTVEDVLYNYDHRIITDCSLHKQHAQNQFRALREFLDK